MSIETAKKAIELYDQIKELEVCYYFIQGRYREAAHFEFVEHWEDNSAKKVQFSPKHTSRFLKVVDEIIIELKAELESL